MTRKACPAKTKQLCPADNQQTIDDEVSFTAGDAVLANGQIVPAMLGVLSGELGWVYVYPDSSQPFAGCCRSMCLRTLGGNER